MRPPRPAAALVALGFATLLLAPVALAAASCLPPACALARGEAFLPPVSVVRAGEPLRWQSMDIAHTSTEDVTGRASSPCFNVIYSSFRPSDAVVFTFSETGALQATVLGVTKTCATAATSAGSAVLTYNCRYHVNMVGALAVLAG